MHSSLKRYNFLYKYIISEDRVQRTLFCFLLFLITFNLSACDTIEKSTEKYINTQFSNLNLYSQEKEQNTPNNDSNISLIDSEVSHFVSDVGSVLKNHTKNLITSSETQDLADTLTNTTLRAGIETALSILESSDIERLRRLEIEYGLNNKGLNRLSLLTVQPLYEAENLSHNLFAQGSFMFSDEMGRTANAGIAYRYATSDQKHIYGINMFFDHQWPYAHNRMSIGFDYKTR